MLGGGGGNVTFPGIGFFPRNTFINNVSMYFGATEKWHVQMVMVTRIVQLAGAIGRAPWNTCLQSPSLCSNLGYARRINIVLWMLMYNQPKSS